LETAARGRLWRFPLGHTDGLGTDLAPWKEGNGFIGTLSMPFLLRDSWNDLSLYPPEELLEKDEAEYDRQIEKFEAVTLILQE